MINWIEKTQENMVKFGVFLDKRLWVFLDANNTINFKDGVLVTHFALKSEYEAILPQKLVLRGDYHDTH